MNLQGPTLEEAERAGRDCAVNGANESNCHFRFFATHALTAAWERGRQEMKMLESFDVQMTLNGFVLSVYRDANHGSRTVWLERDKLLAELHKLMTEAEGNMHD